MSHAHALPATGCWMLVLVGGWWLVVSGRSVQSKRWELFTLRSGNVWKADGRSVTAGPTNDCLLSFETSKMQKWPVG